MLRIVLSIFVVGTDGCFVSCCDFFLIDLTGIIACRDVLIIDEVERSAIKVFKEVIKHCKKEMDEDVWIGMKSKNILLQELAGHFRGFPLCS